MRKNATLLLITVFAVLSLVMVETVCGQQPITTPSVPEFTVNVVNGIIEVRIKNQPFDDYYDANRGSTIFFYYNIRVKQDSASNWGELYNPSDGFLHQDDLAEYTEVSYSSSRWGFKTISFPSGVQVDFQVEAMIGYTHRQVSGGLIVPWIFTGETSGWSDTQTITIEEAQTPSPSSTSSPEPTSTIEPTPYNEPTEQTLILGLAITLAVLGAGLGLLIFLIKRK